LSASAAYKELGWLDFTLYILNEISNRTTGRQPLRKYYLFAQPVPAKPMLPRNRGATIHVRVMSADEALHSVSRPKSVLMDRIRQDALCLGAFQDLALIGYIWYMTGVYQEDEVRCDFLPAPQGQSAWDFDIFLEPRCRGTFAFPRLWDAAFEQMRLRGIKWSMSRISAFNSVSIESQKRMNARIVGSLTFFKLWGCQFMFGSLPPYVHLSIGQQSRPLVRVPAPSVQT
jgi:hypothetical protein